MSYFWSKSYFFWVDRNPALASASYLATLLWRKDDEDYFSPKLRVGIKDNNNSPHGKYLWLLSPFSSSFRLICSLCLPVFKGGSRILKWGVNFCSNVREIKYYFNIRGIWKKHGELVLANSSWYVWKAQKQSANKLANCWQEIELASILANFFVVLNLNLTCERLANMCW